MGCARRKLGAASDLRTTPSQAVATKTVEALTDNTAVAARLDVAWNCSSIMALHHGI